MAIINSNVSSVYGFIDVTYPSGSTCSCSLDGYTIHASDTSGTFRFLVPCSGTWTISCENTAQGKSASKTESIVTFGESKSVELAYSRLPSAYQEVEYLQSSGTQYIDTNLLANMSYTYKLKLDSIVSSGQYNYLFGSAVAWQNRMRFVSSYYSTEIALNYGDGSYFVALNNFSSPYNLELRGGTWKINGISQPSIGGSVSPILTDYLFATSSNNYPAKSSYKLYEYSVYNGNTLVREFIPCYRKSDSVAGLWESVTETFFVNDGTGTFTVGGDV